RLIALAAELRGQAVRRGSNLTRLWRVAGWLAGASLAWPLLVDAGFSEHRFHPVEFFLLAAPVLLASPLWLNRVGETPERRAMARREDRAPHVSRLGAVATLVAGPASLVWAWRQGFDVRPTPALVAMLPALFAWWPVRRLLPAPDASGLVRESVPGGPRDFAL